jgi:hypothetical protein
MFDRLIHLSKQTYSLFCRRHTDAQLLALEFVVTSADSKDQASIAHAIHVCCLTRHLERATVQDAVH